MIPYAMLYSVAVGVPIALAAVALAALLRRHGRPERLVWAVALVVALALPLVALSGGLERPAAPTVDSVSAAGSVAAVRVTAEPTDVSTGVIGLPEFVAVADDAGMGLGNALLLAWLLASLALLGRWALATHRLRRTARTWRRDTLDGLDVWMTGNLGPAVAGALRPRVLVPSWLLSLPPGERALVLLHEQEHTYRFGPALNRGTRVPVWISLPISFEVQR